jgi:hypothetical protein
LGKPQETSSSCPPPSLCGNWELGKDAVGGRGSGSAESAESTVARRLGWALGSERWARWSFHPIASDDACGAGVAADPPLSSGMIVVAAAAAAEAKSVRCQSKLAAE